MDSSSLARNLGSWSLGKGPLQQKLVRALTQAVRNGFLNPGSRLPSERALAQSLMLSRTTVVAAYDALREAGWLESRSGSGTWVCASADVAGARGSARADSWNDSPLLDLLGAHKDADRLDFALGTPFPLDDFPLDLFTVPPDEYRAMMRDRHYYPLGLAALRHCVARLYAQAGVPTRPEEVLVTNGAQAAISLCAALCLQRGDSVLVEDPAYFGALDAFRTAGARIEVLPVGPDGVRPSTVRERIQSAAARLVYLTPTYQNPTGAVIPATARKELARIAAESGVPVIDDCTLSDLSLDRTAPPPPLAAFAPQAPILTIGSLSKLVCPSLRIGWVRAPAWIVERLARVRSSLDLASPLLTQAIAVRVLENLGLARDQRRQQLQPRRDLLARLLRKRLPEWTFRVPSGGLFFWVKLPHGDSRDFAQLALRHGVLILPGPYASAVGRHEGYLRLPFLADPPTLRAGVQRLAAAWKDYASTGPSMRDQRAVI